MCGIVGIWNFSGQELNEIFLNQLTDALAHRGPDGRGIFVDEKANLGLGHRRLAILDISDKGHQPMPYGGRRYWITFNGEIYNFIELRTELEKYGHYFKTDSDTEVVLASYIQWGQDCQLKLNGMWAFAIWDTVEKTLFLSRDRFGVKPLFFLTKKDHFIFASELKAFMALPLQLRPDFDLRMVARMKNEETVDQTLLENVENLNGGCCLLIRNRGFPKVRKWWKTSEHLRDAPKQFEDQIAMYKELFSDACRIRMRSDVPIGTALSGGLDSSSALCTMSEIRSGGNNSERLAREWQKAFVLVYSGTTHDESAYANSVINQTGADPVFKEIDPVDISSSDIEASIFSFEAIQNAEPSIGPWLIYEEMRKAGVFVSIDGLGGDETLAGYHEYVPIAMKDAIWPFPRPQRWRDLHRILSGLYEGEISEGSNPYIPTVPDILNTMIPGVSEGKEALYLVLKNFPWLLEQLRNKYRTIKTKLSATNRLESGRWLQVDPTTPTTKFREKKNSGWNYLQQYLYNDFHYGTNSRSLRNFDRMSMSSGIESRAPFMDWRLVCFSFSLPTESKLGGGYTKHILREAMRGTLPEDIRSRKGKLGFASPMPVWYQHGLRNNVLDILNSQQFLESEIWNGPKIRDHTEKCYQQEHYVEATKSWKFIQAYLLMNSFQKSIPREAR